MDQSGYMGAIYRRLSNGMAPLQQMPETYAPGIMESYMSKTTRAPINQPPPPPTTELPAFQMNVPAQMPQPQPTIEPPAAPPEKKLHMSTRQIREAKQAEKEALQNQDQSQDLYGTVY